MAKDRRYGQAGPLPRYRIRRVFSNTKMSLKAEGDGAAGGVFGVVEWKMHVEGREGDAQALVGLVQGGPRVGLMEGWSCPDSVDSEGLGFHAASWSLLSKAIGDC